MAWWFGIYLDLILDEKNQKNNSQRANCRNGESSLKLVKQSFGKKARARTWKSPGGTAQPHQRMMPLASEACKRGWFPVSKGTCQQVSSRRATCYHLKWPTCCVNSAHALSLRQKHNRDLPSLNRFLKFPANKIEESTDRRRVDSHGRIHTWKPFSKSWQRFCCPAKWPCFYALSKVPTDDSLNNWSRLRLHSSSCSSHPYLSHISIHNNIPRVPADAWWWHIQHNLTNMLTDWLEIMEGNLPWEWTDWSKFLVKSSSRYTCSQRHSPACLPLAEAVVKTSSSSPRIICILKNDLLTFWMTQSTGYNLHWTWNLEECQLFGMRKLPQRMSSACVCAAALWRLSMVHRTVPESDQR